MAKRKRVRPKHYEEVKPFRLLDLPPEIWSKIGLMLRDGRVKSRDRAIPTPVKVLTCNLSVPSASQQPPITRVCRVLREELLSYYYSTKIYLSYRELDDLPSNLGKWLRAVGQERRRWVRTMGLSIYPWMTSLPEGSETAGALEKRLKTHWKVDLKVGMSEDVGVWRRTGVNELL